MESSGSTILREVDNETMISLIQELKTWVANQTTVPELPGEFYVNLLIFK